MRGEAMIEAKGVHNMPLTDPCSFLRRAVTSLAAGAAVNATAIVATRPALAAAVVQEDPAIITLGEQIEPLLATYRGAAADRLKARADAEAGCPAVPEEIVCNGPFWAGCTESECDVEGREISRPPRQILHSEQTKAAIARGNLYCDRRRRFGKEIVRLIDTAEKYEAEREAAIERSGLGDARMRQILAGIEIGSWPMRQASSSPGQWPARSFKPVCSLPTLR
jgi:hypothetical protein